MPMQSVWATQWNFSLLDVYFLYQVPANHLISASVMSAPAALAMSKLFYPETKKSKTTAKDVDAMEAR